MNIRRPTVLAVHTRDDGVMGGCENYRMCVPFRQIREQVDGSIADWVSMKAARRWCAGQLGLRTRPTDYDVIVWTRPMPLPYGARDGDGNPTPSYPVVRRQLGDVARQFGIELEGKSHTLDLIDLWKRESAIVLEYDDDHTGSRQLANYEHYELVGELMRRADALTVTTPWLRQRCLEAAPDTPVYVLPNCVHFGAWQEWPRWKRWPERYIVIGLTGSVTHYDDWLVLGTALPQIMRDHGNVALLLQGFVPDYLEPLLAQYPDRVYADDKFRVYEEYPSVVRQADIVLCPVVPEDAFNQAKSGIKAIEALAAGRPLASGGVGGAAPIVSPLNYYREVVGHGSHRGITIKDHHNADEWYDAIATLVTDQEKRERYGRLGWNWVRKNRAIETKWRLWWDAYRDIYRRKQNGNAIAKR